MICVVRFRWLGSFVESQLAAYDIPRCTIDSVEDVVSETTT